MWVVPTGCLGSIAICAGCFASIIALVFGLIKSSYAYEQSLAMIRQSPKAQAALGTPIEPALLVNGNINVNGPSGHADISYHVSGPQGAATAYVVANKSGGQWTFGTLDLELEATGERLDLLSDP